MHLPRSAIAAAVLALSLQVPVFATPAMIASAPALDRKTTPAPELVAKLEAEATAQKAQLTTMKEYHSSLLDTVYWALGTLASVTALLAGFGWFANFKFYEADKARLKDDFSRMLAEASAKSEATMATAEATLLHRVETRIEAAVQRQLVELQALRTELADLAKSQTSDKAALDQITQGLATRLNIAGKNINTVEANMRQVEEHVWEIKGIPTNKLITQGQALNAALESNHPYYVTAAIERMIKTIQSEILPKGHKLSESMLNSLQSTVASAAKIEPIPASELSELLKSIPASGKV